MRQLVYQVCYTGYQVSFYLWWTRSVLIYCKVPKYNDQDWRLIVINPLIPGSNKKTKRSHILKQSWKLQVCLSMFDLFCHDQQTLKGKTYISKTFGKTKQKMMSFMKDFYCECEQISTSLLDLFIFATKGIFHEIFNFLSDRNWTVVYFIEILYLYKQSDFH